MKRLSLLIVFSMFTLNHSAQALSPGEYSANFKASNGRTFSIRYTLSENIIPGEATVRAVTAMQLSTPATAGNVNAALINNCFHEFDGEFKGQMVLGNCQLGNSTDGAQLTSSLNDCQVSQSFVDPVGFSFTPMGANSLLVSHRMKAQAGEVCHQELVMQVDGEYLQDPVSGTNNFKFDFDY